MKPPRAGVPSLLAAMLLAGCAALQGPRLAHGQTEADVLALLGPPSERYPMPGGVQRLQWVSGPFGRQTWMVDIGPDGRSLWFAQVLTRRYLFDFAQRAQGMDVPQLLRELGRPAERRANGWGGGQTWSWRFVTNDCLWWQVSLDAHGRVSGAGEGPDPLCEARDRHGLF
ncbi:MAG: hypothetical protein ABS84_07010 [Rubrivivax sp. SCN 71-131]|jgi:hypothetical protein|nr:MAG: hypothetical protein ABS84_07010 [Rubrivivax sp. SCN 71-131]